MKFTTILALALASVAVAQPPKVAVAISREVDGSKRALGSRDFSSKPTNAKRTVNYGRTRRDTRKIAKRVNASLIPEFGHSAGVNPTGTGDCDGVNPAVKIPCSCPPDRGFFIDSLNRNVAAGRATNNPGVLVSFPEDDSRDAKLGRLQAATVTLQNLFGPGVGCPSAATTFNQQREAIERGEAPPAAAPPPAPAPAAPAPPPPAPAGSEVARLAPDLGHPAGLNPTGTGDCDGITGPNGQAVKIPCSCPPSRDEFIRQLEANVAAGRAVNNPSVSISYPLDDSNASKRARITASLITLQNLKGPGVGCPAVATTLLAQQNAIP